MKKIVSFTLVCFVGFSTSAYVMGDRVRQDLSPKSKLSQGVGF